MKLFGVKDKWEVCVWWSWLHIALPLQFSIWNGGREIRVHLLGWEFNFFKNNVWTNDEGIDINENF